jgi:DnaK suppressor protein
MIERRLEEERAKSLREMRDAEEELRELSAERESELEEEAQKERRMQALGTVDDRLCERLAAIDEALDRLARGEYGLCVDCGEPIPLARLEAVPSARRCVECAERDELHAAAGAPPNAPPAGAGAARPAPGRGRSERPRVADRVTESAQTM